MDKRIQRENDAAFRAFCALADKHIKAADVAIVENHTLIARTRETISRSRDRLDGFRLPANGRRAED